MSDEQDWIVERNALQARIRELDTAELLGWGDGSWVEQLTELCAKGVPMSDEQVGRWISVKDREPDYDTDVILWAGGWRHVYIGYFAHWQQWIGRYNPDIDKELPPTDPTHWMPFPEPPAASPAKDPK